LKNIYCIDTSSWIELKDKYPFDVFSSLWNNLASLINDNRIISPSEVENEIRDNELIRWIKPNKDKIFIRIDQNQAQVVSEILKVFPRLVDVEKTTPDADPFVIALALAKTRAEQATLLPSLKEHNKYIVVCEESALGKGLTHKIPHVCRHFDIHCIKIVELFRSEKWEF